MEVQNTPDKEICKLLGEIIVETTEIWSDYVSAPDTDYEQFAGYPVPEGNIDRVTVGRQIVESYSHPNLEKVRKLIGADICTNALILAPQTMMFWHTNIDGPGERTYYNFTLGPGIFRFLSPDGDLIDDYDQKGWTTRSFMTSAEEPLWHCIWANERRFSFGFLKKLL